MQRVTFHHYRRNFYKVFIVLCLMKMLQGVLLHLNDYRLLHYLCCPGFRTLLHPKVSHKCLNNCPWCDHFSCNHRTKDNSSCVLDDNGLHLAAISELLGNGIGIDSPNMIFLLFSLLRIFPCPLQVA